MILRVFFFRVVVGYPRKFSTAFKERDSDGSFQREADIVPELRLRLRTANSDNAPNMYLRALPHQEFVVRTRVPILNSVRCV